MTGEIVLGLCNGILAFAGLAMWRTLRYQGGRITELEADKRAIEADKRDVQARYDRERSNSATAGAVLKNLRSDVDACVSGGCSHRPECPALQEYVARTLA